MSRAVALLLVLAAMLSAGCAEPARPTLDLNRAVQLGDLDQIKRHAHWGTDLDQPDADGERPLHRAARAGKVGIVSELARHGARLDALDAQGRTPLELALAFGKTQAAEALVDAGAALDPQAQLDALVDAGVSDRDSFDFLLRRGARLDAADAEGRTPLHRAVAQGHLETVRRLLQRGAPVNQPDASGLTPLDVADRLDPRGANSADILASLRQFGALTGARIESPSTTR